jgi:hypothetical protein
LETNIPTFNSNISDNVDGLKPILVALSCFFSLVATRYPVGKQGRHGGLPLPKSLSSRQYNNVWERPIVAATHASPLPKPAVPLFSPVSQPRK